MTQTLKIQTHDARDGAATALLPGILLCAGVTLAADALQAVEVRMLGRSWLEALVLAIILGTVVRTIWQPGPRFASGIKFCAAMLLEIAVVLLGANISARMLVDSGSRLLLGIAVVVCIAICSSYLIGRLLGLSRRMATLIACGNSICGNSAIAAVAPVIGAHSDDVASAIAFTAVLGVAVVLGLPVLAQALDMNPKSFGILAGLTVYAVPQVLAATAPISSVSAQIGTLVKLVRVLMLGPLVLLLSIFVRWKQSVGMDKVVVSGSKIVQAAPHRIRIGHVVPWFIAGFLLMIGARSADFIPTVLLAPIAHVSIWLTVVSMAALGLGVDVQAVAKAGPRITAVVVLSLLLLGLFAWALIWMLSPTS